MADIYPPTKQREALLSLRGALGCRDNALRRDECSDWRISGKQGWVYTVPEGFQLVFFARTGVNEWDGEGPHIEDYVRAKRNLIFCRLAQDGTGEGIFVLDRLPTPDEAEVIRDTLVISKKRDMGEPSEAQMAARAVFASRARTKAPETATTDDPHPRNEAGCEDTLRTPRRLGKASPPVRVGRRPGRQGRASTGLPRAPDSQLESRGS
jgi:hypothetical protein